MSKLLFDTPLATLPVPFHFITPVSKMKHLPPDLTPFDDMYPGLLGEDIANILAKYYPEGTELRHILVTHSEAVAVKALECAAKSYPDIDRRFVAEAAMLHDIGIYLCDAPGICCHGTEPYIRHGIMGGALLRKEGFPEYARVCERHTGAGLTAEDIRRQNLPLPIRDFLPETIEEKLICYADKFFSKSGILTAEKPLDRVLKSMEKHGADTLDRFIRLHKLFADTGKYVAGVNREK